MNRLFTVQALLPEPSSVDRLVAYKVVMEAVNAKGITSVLEAWGEPEAAPLLRFLKQQNELTARWNVAWYIPPDWNEDWEAIESLKGNADEWLHTNQVKLWMDGVMVTLETADCDLPVVEGGVFTPDSPGLGITVRRDVLGDPVAAWEV